MSTQGKLVLNICKLLHEKSDYGSGEALGNMKKIEVKNLNPEASKDVSKPEHSKDNQNITLSKDDMHKKNKMDYAIFRHIKPDEKNPVEDTALFDEE